MSLKKYKLGELIEESYRKNDALKYDVSYVRGISNNKEIMQTKADVDERVISKFYIVNPGEFVYNPRTTRMGNKVGLGFNDTDSPLLFSFNNIAFFIRDDAKTILLPEYLYLYFNRSEFDRYAMIHGWGSATELFSMDELCDINIELPDLPTQQKFVDVYKAMVANQKAYEKGLDDLKLTCDAYIEELRRKIPYEKIGPYIQQSDRRNDIGLTQDDVRGISIEKKFIFTKADMTGVNVANYKIVEPEAISFVPVTSRNGEKITIALNNSDATYLVSATYEVFTSKNKRKLLPAYLAMFFNRTEFDRYARFHSWGSARETFNWNDMQDVKIPIPDFDVQQAIVNIFKCYLKRKAINERLKTQIKDLCPILIRGSIEAQKEI